VTRSTSIDRRDEVCDYSGNPAMPSLVSIRRLLPFVIANLRLGLPAARRGLDYTRGLEYPLTYAFAGLDRPGLRLLDVGSGAQALFARTVARRARAQVTILDYQADLSRRRHDPFAGVRGDARSLPFADASFDRVTLVSAVEHFEGDGDAAAMREAARVLRPGGRCILTTPFDLRGARDVFRPGPVYGRGRAGEPTFFERCYDLKTLDRRLILPSGLALAERRFFGEPGFSFEAFRERWLVGSLPGKVLNIPFGLSMPLLTLLFFRDLGSDPPPLTAGKAAGKGGGVLLALDKPV
jgi:SAM-dependent methyltransferase